MKDEDDEIKIESENEEGATIPPWRDSPDASDEEASKKVVKLREELGVCRKEKQEYMDGWQRAKADYVNLLKRIETDMKSAEFKGKVKAVETLLPAFDALERAKDHGDVPEGFVGITKQLESAFAALGLEEVGAVGEPFNPALHEAFGQEAAETLETDDTITLVLEKGWRVGDNVIRPAKVRVAHYSVEA